MGSKTSSLQNIKIKDIDFSNEYFKLNLNPVNEKNGLLLSEFGMLEYPILLAENKRYTIISCYNRLDYLMDAGKSSVDAEVVDKLEPDHYLRYIILKVLREDVSPVVRLRIIGILRDYFNLDEGKINHIGKRALGIPEKLISDISETEKILNLPESLLIYLEQKDVHYRVLRDITRLPEHAVDTVSGWVMSYPLKINIFRAVIDFLYDINIRDKSLSFIDGIDIASTENRKEAESLIFDTIFRKRYPVYSGLRESADDIIRSLSGKGVHVDFPEYFEGDSIALTLRLKKGDKQDCLVDIINSVLKTGDIDDLLQLL